MVKEHDLKSNTFVNSYLDGNKAFAYMSKSDFIVIPSRIESIPIVLSDALQSNKPIILTNVGDIGVARLVRFGDSHTPGQDGEK